MTNYKRIEELAKDKGITLSELSNSLGYNDNYIFNARSRHNKLKPPVMRLIAQTLGCTVEDLDGETIELAKYEESEFEITVKEQLQELTKKVNAINEMLIYIFNQKQQERQEDDEEKGSSESSAYDVLMKMFSIANCDSIKYDDYIGRLKVLKITEAKVISDAIAQARCGIITRGYGNNKTKWIIKSQE